MGAAAGVEMTELTVAEDDYAEDLRDWHAEDSLDGAALLDDVRRFLARFVAYPSVQALIAHALWIGHTWFMGIWDSTPRLAFLSPEPGSGKSRSLEVTEPLVPRPVHAVNTTPAYLFRKVSDEAGAPTILYDEIDTVFGPKAKDNEDIRGMLNAGHRKGATAGRCVMRGKIVETEELPAYCAVAFAGLNDLPDTIMSRCVVVRMRRRAADEQVEPWRPRLTRADAEKLRDQLAVWAQASAERIEWPDMPPGVSDRDADIWEALLAVADLAGGHWPALARDAAVTLVTQSRQRPPSIGVLLLHDIRAVFDESDCDVLRSEQLIAGLTAMPEAPWNTIRKGGNPIDQRSLSQRLSNYGIASKTHRVGAAVVRGYAREQFTDAWKRYVTDDVARPSPPESVTTVTPVTTQVSEPPDLIGCNGNVVDVTDGATGVTEVDALHALSKNGLTSDVTAVTDVTQKSGNQAAESSAPTQEPTAPCSPPGGLTAATPGQTDRVARSLANAKAASAEQNDRYRNRTCVDCGERPPSAGRPRCDDCHPSTEEHA